jgi:FMN-dependent NADH-azoreductase
MKNVLLIQSSPRGEQSFSRKLTNELLAKLREKDEIHVVERDLSASPLPHLQAEQLAAFYTPPEQRSAELREAIRLSDEAVDQLLAADIVVLSAPVWNFSAPSVLKAWIDHVVRAGRTFSYGADGVKGLVKGKKVYVISASGGVLSNGPMDFLGPYLKAVLGFIGLTEVALIQAEGFNDPRQKDQAFAKAQKKMEEALAVA